MGITMESLSKAIEGAEGLRAQAAFETSKAADALNALRRHIDSTTKDYLNALHQFREVFSVATVAPIPKWQESKIPGQDELRGMDDECFAKCRAKLSKHSNLVVRMNAQLALAVAIRGIIDEKRQRIAALKERIDATRESCAETTTAKNMVKNIGAVIEALELKMFKVIEDYAITRRAIVRAVGATTNKIAEMFEEPNSKLVCAVSNSNTDISRALELLRTNNEKTKRWPSQTPVLSGIGRAKK